MKNVNGVERRKSALKRLEAQLKTGLKPKKKSTEMVSLDEKDIKRIKKEILILKERI